MGLDMYLNGNKFLGISIGISKKNIVEDGFTLTEKTLELGYWRKHPDLHGYIIQNFANGIDNCQEIELSENQLLDILSAVKNDKLPKTTGCFFGKSTPDRKEETIKILEKAIEWLNTEEDFVSRSITYRASW